MKNILFFLSYHGRPNLSIEIQTEIILNHLSAGDFVYIVLDTHDLIFQSQSGYPRTSASKYNYLISINKLTHLLQKYKDNYEILKYRFKNEAETPSQIITSFNEINDVKHLYYKGYNIGYGICSSLISAHRDHGFDIIKNRMKLIREIRVSEIVIDTLEYYCRNNIPEVIYLFNGRLASNAPIVSYCKENDIQFRVYEFTSRKDKYHLLNNAIPHDLDYRYNEMEHCWNDNNIELQKKKLIGASFFENQMKGISLLDEGYLGLQDKNSEVKLSDSKKIITFFNSSIDEFASIPSWQQYVYIFNDEIDAISQICKHYQNDSSKHFILRVHPNLKFLHNTQIKELKKLEKIENLTIYPPESSVFSYQLIKKSDCVIVFGSTIGVEACYLRVPSISLAKSMYEKIDVAYYPKTKDELFSLLDNKYLQPKNIDNSLKYGYWWMTFGEEYSYKKNGYYDESYFSYTKSESMLYLLRKVFSIEMLNRLASGFIDLRIIKPEYRKYLKQRIKKIWS